MKMSTGMIIGTIALGTMMVMSSLDMDMDCLQRRSMKAMKRAKRKINRKMHSMGIY